MLKQILKCSCVFAALVLVFSAIGALVDTDGNAATNQTLLGDIDMGVGTLGDLTAYVTNVVDQSSITDGTNTINASGEVYKKIGIGDGWILVSGLDIGEEPVWRTEEIGESVSGWYAYGLEFGFQLISTEYDAIEITGIVVFASYDGPEQTIITTTNTWVRVNTAEKFLGKVAMTNDAVAVVAPSTNAITGTAADARDTGIAIYTGFTDWRFSDGSRHVVLGPDDAGGGWWYHYITEEGYHNTSAPFPTEVEALCATNLYFGNGIFATRHLVTPTRTSQLENDGPKDGLNVGHPFATTNQIPDITSLSNRIVELENQLSGIHVISTNKYDFSTNVGLYTGVRDIIVALGGTVTNFPAIPSGGN